MLLNIIIGACMMLVTTVIHAGGMLFVFQYREAPGGRLKQWLHRFHAYRIGEVVVVMFIVTLLEVILWALIYLIIDAIEGIEKALYLLNGYLHHTWIR